MRKMGIKRLPSIIAGKLIEPTEGGATIDSLDGSIRLPITETTLPQLRSALRFAEQSQQRLHQTTLAERLSVVKLLMEEYSKRREDIVWGLGKFRGIVAKDTQWMCDLLKKWIYESEELTNLAFGHSSKNSETLVKSHLETYGHLSWQSKGKAVLFCSSTMDGPAAVGTICHGILSGTHVIIRPSWRDTVTHIAYEILLENGLDYYGQLVRWPSDSPHSDLLNKQALTQAAQSLIFSSNETYQNLISAIAAPGTAEYEGLLRKSRRYGTGLPLAIVMPSAESHLEETANELVAGARIGNGKFCLSTSPVLIHESLYPKLKALLMQKAAKLRTGSPLDLQTELGEQDSKEISLMQRTLESFGGTIEAGTLKPSMELMILTDVPQDSVCLHQEFPGALLCLIPIQSLDQAIEIGKASLPMNQREAWTAVVTYGSVEEFKKVASSLESYRHCHGGIVALVKLLLPHQGSYFLLDLMRRTTVEPWAIMKKDLKKGA